MISSQYWNLERERYLLEVSKIVAMVEWCADELQRLNQNAPINFTGFDPTQASTSMHKAARSVDSLREHITQVLTGATKG